MLQALTLFATNFCFIGLKAWQQRNVAFLKYKSVFLVSNLMAIAEVFVIVAVAKSGFDWHTILPIGLGGGLGCITAMYLTRGHNGDGHK